MQICPMQRLSLYPEMSIPSSQFLNCWQLSSRRSSVTGSQCLPLALLDMKLDDITSTLLQVLHPLVQHLSTWKSSYLSCLSNQLRSLRFASSFILCKEVCSWTCTYLYLFLLLFLTQFNSKVPFLNCGYFKSWRFDVYKPKWMKAR